MRADLARLFQTNLDDVWAGRVGFRHALMLLGRARSYPDSLMREHELGPELARWDKTTDAVVHLGDLIAGLLASLGGKTNFEDLRYPRPLAPGAADDTLFSRDIASFDVDSFMQIINN